MTETTFKEIMQTCMKGMGVPNVIHHSLLLLKIQRLKVKNEMGLEALRKVVAVALVFYACAVVWMLAFVMIVKGDGKR